MSKIHVSYDVFMKIYELNLSLWPSTVNTTVKELFSNGGAYIPNLARIQDSVELELEKNNYFSSYIKIHNLAIEQVVPVEQIVDSINWAMYTEFHSLAKKVNLLVLANVNPSNIYKRYLSYTFKS